MKNLILIAIPFFSVLANAQNYTPILDSGSIAGRLRFKEIVSGDYVYAPALLSQRFFCNEQNGICTLQIFNRMNTSEEERVKQYESEGLGQFKLKYHLNGMVRDFLIRISMNDLSTLITEQMGSDSMSFSDLKVIVKSQLPHLSVQGYLMDDVVVIIAHQLKEKVMKSTQFGRFKFDESKWSQFKQQMKGASWIISESLGSAVESCTVTLDLKKDAQMIQSCEVIHEIAFITRVPFHSSRSTNQPR